MTSDLDIYRSARLLIDQHGDDAPNRAKSDFLAVMSHELRSPLNAIIGFSEVIKDQMFGPAGKPQYVDYAAYIHTGGQHLLGLINDILDLSKIEAGKMELDDEDVAVAEVVDASPQFVKERIANKGLILNTEVNSALPALRADRSAVLQMLLNLLTNAVKFTPEGGTITLSAASDDGVAERIRPGQKREPVLVAWGFTAEGRKVLLRLMAGSKEDHETVSAFFQDMRSRGLGDPLLVVSDGAPGVIKAIETCFPRSERQRCLAHRMRNLAAKVPEDLWPEFKARATASYQAPSRAIARDLADGIVADFEAELPSAVACFMDDFEACIAHLRMPVTHRRAIRTTNLLERLFVEERRRLKIIPNAWGEKAVLKLMFGAMIRAAERWRAIKVTDFERRQMAAVRAQLDQEYEARNGLGKDTSGEARQIRISSSSRT